VFENIIEQGAVLQLKDDILRARRAPSMLFYGPPESGKGSAALELARVLSCGKGGEWKCSCPSCERHRYLQHDDLLVLGPRSFQAEISASLSAFLRSPDVPGAKLLFYRALRKLQIRFSPVLIEDDPKVGKIASVLQSLDEGLDEFLRINIQTIEKAALEKKCAALVKDALALDSEGQGGAIPIGRIRRACYWCRIAPNGKRKTLIIENAENMREEARNSLLKLLEEPPDTICIVLTAQRREAIMATILSRLRPYRFLKRSAESEKEVIRRVFQDSVNEKIAGFAGSVLSAYLDSFLARGSEKMYPLAAWFIVSLARSASVYAKKNGAGAIPRFVNALGERYAPIANAVGIQRVVRDAEVVKTLLARSGNFENDSFSRFLKICLDLTGGLTRETGDPQFIAYNSIFIKHIGEAVTAVDVLNQSTTLALEALFHKLKKDIIRGINV
jgi:DNA polymerase-3 subunit gamma/tau